MLNQWIELVYSAGLSQVYYYGAHVIGFVAVFIFNLFYGKHYGLSRAKSILSTVIVYPLTYLLMLGLFTLEKGVFGGQNIVRVFVYVPLICGLAAKLLKVKWRDVCDFLAPSPLIVHAISHLGCNFAGCCYGFPMHGGIYNPVFQAELFPEQILESLVAFAILLYVLRYARKRQYRTEGRSYPIMLILFGTTRFFLEFFRDNTKVFLDCSDLAFHAAVAAIVGTIWLAVLDDRQGCERAFPFTEKRVPGWKQLVLLSAMVLLTMAGEKIMGYAETGSWLAHDIFGGIVLLPVLLILCRVLQVSGRDTLSTAAWSQCGLWALYKLKCLQYQCCYGTILSIRPGGEIVRFPSQLVEFAVALVIMAALICMLRFRWVSGSVYPWYVLLFGISRMILDGYRDTTPWLLQLSAGRLTAVCAIVMGLAWLVTARICRNHSK